MICLTGSEEEASIATEIESWLCERICERLTVPRTAIDRNLPFTEFGLDSLAAVTLAGELERRLGRPVSPSLAWEYPTIAEAAQFLAEVVSEKNVERST